MTENKKKGGQSIGTRRQGLREKGGQRNPERGTQEALEQHTLQTEGFLLRETAAAEPCMTETKKHAWIWHVIMEIPKRKGRGEILSLKMSTDIETGTVRILEGGIDPSQEKKIKNIQVLEARTIGIRTVLRGNGKNLADTLNNPENQRKVRTGEEKSLQQSKKNNSAKSQKLNMPYIQLQQSIFYID